MHCRPLLALAFAGAVASPALASEVERVAQGVVVTPDSGAAKRVRVLVYGDGRFRVSASPDAALDLRKSYMVVASPGGAYAVSDEAGIVTVRTARGTAEIRRADGHVRFLDARGQVLLDEAARGGFTPVTVEGKRFVTVTQQFNRGTDEGFYGLGQHQNRQMNYNGEDVELAQHNMDIAIPFVVSTKNYGVLWDNDSITRFGDPTPPRLIGDGLKIVSGDRPGWTARYYLGDRLAVTRVEPTIDYQFIRDQVKWPAAAKAQTAASGESGQNTAGVALQKQRVVWTGDIVPDATGIHKLRLYSSSYVKVYADGKLLLDRWRQNWNPWFHNVDVPMTRGKPVSVRIEWEPNQGYIAFYGSAPLAPADRHSLWLSSELGNGLDYYVVTADDADGVIAGYRALTGKASMMPRWAYGFWQSRQRYETQEQLLDVLREYRRRRVPIDNIVLDWRYWEDPKWGSHEFDPSRFADPARMVDEVHALNGHIMISVWPKFYPTTDNGRELDRRGFLYRRPLDAGQKDWVGPGYANTYYDPYQPGARDLYFDQVDKQLVSKGFDAWWMDATEPDWHSNLSIDERKYQMTSKVGGPGAAIFNSYPLVHAEGMANGLRGAQPKVRPFILTRSGFGGLQRTSSALWSGDVAARWDDLRDQVSAGVNLSMSGVPNWTHDIGGFAVEDRYTRADPAHLAEWRELNLRWFQFGAWSPLFRSHGEAPRREIFEIARGDKAMEEAMIRIDRERYRLLPYLYGAAADTYWRDGTMMRGLVMDFAADRRTWAIDDQYMLGSAFLVAPVTEYKARSRQVYLPAGADWYDWSTGRFHRGGRSVRADAPRERMPLFVRSGSIVPTGADVQHSAEQPDGPIVLHVFTGRDGRYNWYDDDGTSTAYLQGRRAEVPISWNEQTGTLTIGPRQGGFEGMDAKRAISVRFYSPNRASTPDYAENAAKSVVYDGTSVTIRR